MAYNRVNIGNISGKSALVYSQKALSGGFSNYENGNNGALKTLSDMLFENGELLPRGGFCEKAAFSGKFHSILEREFEGKILLHLGGTLFGFDGSSLSAISEDIPDCNSVFLAMNGSVYLFCRLGEIYEIKKGMICQKAEPYVPEITYSRNLTMTDFDVKEPVNLLTRKVKCSYKTFTDNANYNVPYEVDENVPIEVYTDGVLNSTLKMSCSGSKQLSMRGTGTLNGVETVSLVFAVSENEEAVKENLEKIYGCSIAFCYGGTANDGTRAFLSGNDDFPGSYFRSELKQPLYFPDTSEEILGDGSEKITAAQKRYEKLFFFTENGIYSMQYQFSVENGASFPVTEVYSTVGCDMKNSVRSIDNTPVFADSKSGIYILQSTDIFDELNVKHISANLAGEWDIPNEKNRTFASCDHDRKYYISDGNRVFVWDYGKTPYYNSGDHDAAEARLAWYKLSGVSDCAYIFTLDGELYFLTDAGSVSIFTYSKALPHDTYLAENGETKIPVSSYFQTKDYDLNTKRSKKRLVYFSFDCTVYEKGGGFKIDFFGDQELFYSFTPPIPEKSRRIKIKLPSYYADKFAVRFSFDGARVGISGLEFCYIPIGREKYNL